jgi:hypothetical protein
VWGSPFSSENSIRTYFIDFAIDSSDGSPLVRSVGERPASVWLPMDMREGALDAVVTDDALEAIVLLRVNTPGTK